MAPFPSSLWTASGRTISGNGRPDIIVIDCFGRYNFYEVASPGQDPNVLRANLNEMMQKVPKDLQGEVKVFEDLLKK